MKRLSSAIPVAVRNIGTINTTTRTRTFASRLNASSSLFFSTKPTRYTLTTQRRSYTVNLKQVQQLRARTDAPLMDCKNALAESEGDFDKAIQWLRKKGAARAVKKEGRATEHGLLVVVTNDGGVPADNNSEKKAAMILHLCSETDFAAKNDHFLKLSEVVRSTAAQFLNEQKIATDTASTEAVVQELSQLLKEPMTHCIATLGENLTLADAVFLPAKPAEDTPPPPSAATNEPSKTMTDSVFGWYLHNSPSGFPYVGQYASVVRLGMKSGGGEERSYADAQKTACELAQHLVSRLGDKSQLSTQPFLGSDESCGKWLKRNRFVFQGSVTLKFGGEPSFRVNTTQAISSPAAPKE